MATEARRMMKEGVPASANESFTGQLVGKWGEFLEGMPSRTAQDKYTMGVTAILMENQSRDLQNMTEDTRDINIGSFTKFIFPVLRRVFPNLIANEIVSVQPMTASVGAVFYLDYQYDSNKGQTTSGNIFPRDFDKDYSSEFINGEICATGDGTDYGVGGSALGVNLAWTPVRPLDTTNGFSVQVVDYDANGNVVQTATDNGAGGFTFSPAGVGTAGAINYSNGQITGFKFLTPPVSGHPIKALYFYDGELNTEIPQIGLNVTKIPVEAKPRRLKALWSSEAAEDLRAFHGLDAETEIVSAVAQEIALEIDRTIIQELFQASTGTSGTFDRIPPAAISELDHLRSMITVISSISNQIHKKTLRAPANFIVTSPDVSALLSQMTTHGDFRALYTSGGDSPFGPADMPRPLMQHGQFGIYKVGTLQNKWLIYEDPFFTSDQMLIGLKGASYLDAGYVWAPYIPLQVTPTFLNPQDFSFVKGLRTRYASQLLRSEFYGQMRITNL